jgi:hypothetical protein
MTFLLFSLVGSFSVAVCFHGLLFPAEIDAFALQTLKVVQGLRYDVAYGPRLCDLFFFDCFCSGCGGFLTGPKVKGGRQANVEGYGEPHRRLAALALVAFGDVIHKGRIDRLSVNIKRKDNTVTQTM